MKNLTPEMLAKAKECKSAEELLAFAKENGIEMTAEQAAEQYAMLCAEGELSDNELDGAAGGLVIKTDSDATYQVMGEDGTFYKMGSGRKVSISGTCEHFEPARGKMTNNRTCGCCLWFRGSGLLGECHKPEKS